MASTIDDDPKRFGLRDSITTSIALLGAGTAARHLPWSSLIEQMHQLWMSGGEVKQAVWTGLHDYFEGDVFTLGFVIPICWSLSLFWLINLPFILIHLMGYPQWVHKYKTQPNVNVTDADYKAAIKRAVWNQVAVSVPFAFVVHQLYKLRGISLDTTDIPDFHWIIWDLFWFSQIGEIGFYYGHRLIHHPRLYDRIHKLHHEFTAPIGVASIYCTELEMLICNLIPIAFGPLIFGSHIITVMSWSLITIHSVTIAHCGYHLPFQPSPEAHDYHHEKATNNFGVCWTAFGIFDFLHGTDSLFRKSVNYQRHVTLMSTTPLTESIPAVEASCPLLCLPDNALASVLYLLPLDEKMAFGTLCCETRRLLKLKNVFRKWSIEIEFQPPTTARLSCDNVEKEMGRQGFRHALRQFGILCPHALRISLPCNYESFSILNDMHGISLRDSIIGWRIGNRTSVRSIQRVRNISRTIDVIDVSEELASTTIPIMAGFMGDMNHIDIIYISTTFAKAVTSHQLIDLFRRPESSIRGLFIPLVVTHAFDDWITYDPITQVKRDLHLWLYIVDNLLASIDFLRQLFALNRSTKETVINFNKGLESLFSEMIIPMAQVADLLFCFLSKRTGRSRQCFAMNGAREVIDYARERCRKMTEKPIRIDHLFGEDMAYTFQVVGVTRIVISHLDENEFDFTVLMPAFDGFICSIILSSYIDFKKLAWCFSPELYVRAP